MTPSIDTHAARCLRCGRTLRVSTGYGPVCRAKIRRAAMETALAEMTPVQAAKAIELIRDGAVVPMRRSGVYQVASSDGSVVYLVHTAGCSCKAGIHGRLCYHRGIDRANASHFIREAAHAAKRGDTGMCLYFLEAADFYGEPGPEAASERIGLLLGALETISERTVSR